MQISNRSPGERRINVLQVITKLELGGAQKITLELLRRLDRSKYRLFLATSSRGILTEEISRIPEIDAHLIPTLKPQISLFNDFKTLLNLFHYIKRNRIDIVHTHSSKAGILGRWAAKFARVPVVVHSVHGWSFHKWQNYFLKRFYIFLERLAANVTDKLVLVSKSDIRKGESAGIATNGKYALIPYGIQTEKFTNNRVDHKKKKKELGLDPDSPLVGMVACLKPQKAPQDFIKAASLVVKVFPGVKFLLVGDGLLRSKIERLIDGLKLKDSVVLAGWRRDIPEIMSILDIFVLSSLWEGLPVVFLEAMATGLPIVATAVDGNCELVKDGINGFLIPPKDYRLLAQRIITLLKEKERARSMGQAGQRMLIDSFSVGYMVSRIENVYDGLIKKKQY